MVVLLAAMLPVEEVRKEYFCARQKLQLHSGHLKISSSPLAMAVSFAFNSDDNIDSSSDRLTLNVFVSLTTPRRVGLLFISLNDSQPARSSHTLEATKLMREKKYRVTRAESKLNKCAVAVSVCQSKRSRAEPSRPEVKPPQSSVLLEFATNESVEC